MSPRILPPIAAALLLVTSPACPVELPGGRDRVLPCRPTIACTADLVPPGTFEVEAGYFYRQAGAAAQRSFPFLLKLTLDPLAQLQIGSNGYTAARGAPGLTYFDDVTVGLKFHLADQKTLLPSLAVSAALSIPVSDEQVGYLRAHDAIFFGYASKDIGPIHADLNLALTLYRLEGPISPQGLATLALSADLIAPFGVMAEAYVISAADPAASRDGGFLFALSLQPRPWIMFDFGGDVGFFPASRAVSAFVGVTVIPAVVWRGR
jgi:hypothetical protein